jgi:glycosyltransferase involved in cell wall biosynthesis
MESVLKQTYLDFEYIIVDGASTDGSVDVIKEYENQLNITHSTIHLLWSSEKDNGIYDAMNRGISKAKGEYTLMLNSGDYLVDECVLERIMPELDGTDIVQGNNIEECNGKNYRNLGYGKSDIDFFDVMKGHFLHQSSFCKRDLFERYGYFDETYKMSGDTKFFMTCLGKNDASFKYIDIDVANYDLGGISAEKTGKWAQLREEEHARLMKELYSPRLLHFFEANDKKIRLYNQLHTHRWIWNLVMLVAHIHNFFYRNIPTIKRKEIK